MFIKRKEFEELKEELGICKDKVEVLESELNVLRFLKGNPSGLDITIEQNIPFNYDFYLKYVKNNQIRTFLLEENACDKWTWEIDNGFIINHRKTPLETYSPCYKEENHKYKFDLENERLIEIVSEEPQDPVWTDFEKKYRNFDEKYCKPKKTRKTRKATPKVEKAKKTEEYMTRQEAAKELGVCLTTLWKLNQQGKLEYFYKDNRTIFRKDDVMKLKKERDKKSNEKNKKKNNKGRK